MVDLNNSELNFVNKKFQNCIPDIISFNVLENIHNLWGGTRTSGSIYLIFEFE